MRWATVLSNQPRWKTAQQHEIWWSLQLEAFNLSAAQNLILVQTHPHMVMCSLQTLNISLSSPPHPDVVIHLMGSHHPCTPLPSLPPVSWPYTSTRIAAKLFDTDSILKISLISCQKTFQIKFWLKKRHYVWDRICNRMESYQVSTVDVTESPIASGARGPWQQQRCDSLHCPDERWGSVPPSVVIFSRVHVVTISSP